jgi:hypothetical protein
LTADNGLTFGAEVALDPETFDLGDDEFSFGDFGLVMSLNGFEAGTFGPASRERSRRTPT